MSKQIISLTLFILLGVAGAAMFIDGLGAITVETHQGVRTFLAFYITFGMCISIAGFSLAIDTAHRLHYIPRR